MTWKSFTDFTHLKMNRDILILLNNNNNDYFISQIIIVSRQSSKNDHITKYVIYLGILKIIYP